MNEKLFKQVNDKLIKEIAEAKINPKVKAIIEHVKNALLNFCKQEDEFAQAIIESDKRLSECCEEIVKDVNTSISDLEVYSRAVQFYFPGADIQFEMKIDLCASVNSSNKTLGVSLMDLI